MELMHYGIKGMHWGTRRFQNEDGTLTELGKLRQQGKIRIGDPQDRYDDSDLVIKKGEHFNSVSKDKKFKLTHKPIYTYDKQDAWDTSVYRGGYSVYLRQYRMAKNVFDHEYESLKDVVLPSYKTKIDTLMKMYKDYPADTAKRIENASAYIRNEDPYVSGGIANGKKYVEEMSQGNFDNAYKVVLKSLDTDYRVSLGERYIAQLTKQGYGGMIDDHNAAIYNKSNNPVIVFNPKDSLKEIGESKIVDDSDINRYANIVYKFTGTLQLSGI